ncbi:polyphosphate kinase 2 family protein [Rhodoblastus acidophilus]|uniref:Polyphosphate kinase 2 family protein n=1 Tax=Candidatus Rhodoblastus alkanivorans TaxID=2954117 RepID=A0ABS9Z5Z0_9HYPH|nr:ADP-polyphosphate phosphotransferase [Candidatus Rhodoblastus alkanivorans]MCI4680529.1 polyphosphate kinase 2 family protein [Candidatus Rhodoblastus alkanivorans]MCI4682820.1 polyphosphate kinase 2 family protein [Candidatus Rhodoblastus alkanivorans]MDI4640129.1 polyphosphate kinase 2 family protein [Rhodoblastus acidophilus]
MARKKHKIDAKQFRVKEGDKVHLKDWPTLIEPVYPSKEDYHDVLAEHVERLSDLQQKLYARDRDALLIIFQAMDAAGKDGAIRHVMSGVNPQGCRVTPFKHPSGVELEHDFLWRTTRELPERGMIGIFNRSYYESVLILRVHPQLLNAEGFDPAKADEKFWGERYRSIVDLERHLAANNVHVLKFFLHLSKEEQRKRFLDRIDEAEKNWKFSQADIVERGFWNDYRKAYEKCLTATSTNEAPWFVVPADDKLSTRLIVSQIILEKLDSLKLAFPTVSEERSEELKTIRAQLEA